MKLTDMLVSYIMKGGIVSESRNLDVDVTVPDSNMVIKIKCEHLTVKVENGSKKEA